jgi:GNAT superfamily N-acetyltransferase
VLEIRPCTNEDEEGRALAIYNAIYPWDAITLDEVHVFRASTLAFVTFLARQDGVDVGSVASALVPTHRNRAWTHLTVPPEQRRHGVGTALYRAVSAWLEEHEIPEILAMVAEDDPVSFAFAERRGFRELNRNGRMILDLADVEAPAVRPPDGIEITTWAKRPELARAIYDVACEALPDIPGEEDRTMETFDQWLAKMQRPSDRGAATFVALSAEETVGYARFSLTAAQPKVAFHDMTGVKRAWRGRGIAGALKRAQVGWAKEQGYARLMTENELRNEPIRRLNKALGYRSAPGTVVLTGPIAA